MTRLSERLEKLSKKQRGLLFLCLFLISLIALVIGLLSKTSETAADTEGSGGVNPPTKFDRCDDFLSQIPSSDLKYSFEGVNCDLCGAIGDIVNFGRCDNSCSDWTLMSVNSSFSPVESTCLTQPPTTEPPAGSEFDCPDGYATFLETGCVADTFDDFIALQQECYLLGDYDTTLEACFEVCERIDNCGGVAVAGDASSCFVFSTALEDTCFENVVGSSVCKPIPPSLFCFDGPVAFDAAAGECAGLSMDFASISASDPFNIQINRLAKRCESDTGCFVGTETDECFFVQDGGLSQDPRCDEERGFCCELPTQSPTSAPTPQPTDALFFVPECDGSLTETDWNEAQTCCIFSGGELAAIHSQEEQDLAWSVCESALAIESNDCGCWTGLNRINQPVSLNPLDFYWSDASAKDYFNFETYPEQQPNNLDNRNEECVHMRPFSNGGWNDLPCLGNCDARDTKPYPLCRFPTPAPTSAPTDVPTVEPTRNPTVTPTVSPTKNPTITPTRNPTLSPTVTPTKNPTTTPTLNPTQAPTVTPTKNPTLLPTTSPTKAPTGSPTQHPTLNPTASPTISPSFSPSVSPTFAPTNSPSTTPTSGPTFSPTNSPTQGPTTSPSISPTFSPSVSPTSAPTNSPTSSPTSSPTFSPTTTPTINPTTSPTKNPTKAPTSSPTAAPSESPTESPTSSPTASPTFPVLPPPVPVCTYGGEETVWTFSNPSSIGFQFQFFFSNPRGAAFFPSRPGIWPDCTFFFCQSFPFEVAPGETFEFVTPGSTAQFIFPCRTDSTEVCNEQIAIESDLLECVCETLDAFVDDFEYPLVFNANGSSSVELFENWQAEDGTIDIIGPGLGYLSEPCIEGNCMVIGEAVQISLDGGSISSRDIEVEPSDAFFEKICTLNFFARGNGICSNSTQPECLAEVEVDSSSSNSLEGAIDVLFNDVLKAGVNLQYSTISNVQGFEAYGLTTGVVDQISEIILTLESPDAFDSGVEGVHAIAPIIDDLSFVCCCPGADDKYINRIVDAQQGYTQEGFTVPEHKSDYGSLVNYVPNYDDINVFALGLGGTITFEFRIGFTDYIYIYEQSFLCFGGCDKEPYDPEDALVEVSVDAENWILVAGTLKGKYSILEGGNEIRFAKVDLPNGACFKYLRIIDNSDVECAASDGFDLVAVEVGEPCCPRDVEPLETRAPTIPGETAALAVGTKMSAVSFIFFAVSLMSFLALVVLSVMIVQLRRRKELEEKQVEERLKVFIRDVFVTKNL